MSTHSDPSSEHALQTIVPVLPATVPAGGLRAGLRRRTLGYKSQSRRTLRCYRGGSRRTLGFRFNSRRTLGKRFPSLRTLG